MAFTALSLAFVADPPPLLRAQDAKPPEVPLTFEVATVKLVDPHKITEIELRVYPGGHLIIHAHRLAMLIAEAFNIPEWEITGGDESVVQAWYDIEGTPPAELRKAMRDSEHSAWTIRDARVRSMLQSLLMERFHLKFHFESQSGTVYQLKRGDGPMRLKPVELKPHTPGEDAAGSSDMTNLITVNSNMPVAFHQTSMLQLAQQLADIRRAPVIDQTELSGLYNFESKTVVTNEDFQDAGPMHLLLDAVPEMGLKLEKAHGVVEKFVIDNVSWPVAN